ncbi:hypothetical protein I4U23_010496 [Adineta vaga]|nr:hypothetical protein I4U23_010496 [Adineta vaga]
MSNNKRNKKYTQDADGWNHPNSNVEDNTCTTNKSSTDPVTSTSKQIDYNYTVTLRVAPVEHGIKCYSSPWHTHQFTGINAFNYYFDYLLSKEEGFTLPNVWDGYFHVTLAKFRLDPKSNLEKTENDLVMRIKEKVLGSNQPSFKRIFPCRFRSDALNVHSGSGRHAEAENIDFVTLNIVDLENAFDKLRPFLDNIEDAVKAAHGIWQYKPSESYFTQAHVTVRKYKPDDDLQDWSYNHIRQYLVEQRVKDNPLEFQCVALDIAQTRRQARHRGTQTQWWAGVTGNFLDCATCGTQFNDESKGTCVKCHTRRQMYECSGCGKKGNEGKMWPGYCNNCGNYERLRPLWSTKP